MALANLAVQAGWADQEIANLLIAHRRKFNEDLKLRDSYYAKTIGKARAAFGSNDSVIAESAAGAPGAPLAKPETEKRPPAASSDRKPASEHLATIGRGFGLRVLRVTKYGGEQDGTFEIAVECQDGIERKVDLGRAIDVLNPRLTQGAIAGAIGAVIPNFKKGDSYLNLCRSIFAAAGPAPVELASDQQELLAWLRQFAAERYIPALNESEKRALGDRLNEGAFAGMWNERGELLLYLPFFLSVLFAVARVRPTWKDVTLRLRKLGFRPVTSKASIAEATGDESTSGAHSLGLTGNWVSLATAAAPPPTPL
jgi:hypothetical protein